MIFSLSFSLVAAKQQQQQTDAPKSEPMFLSSSGSTDVYGA